MLDTVTDPKEKHNGRIMGGRLGPSSAIGHIYTRRRSHGDVGRESHVPPVRYVPASRYRKKNPTILSPKQLRDGRASSTPVAPVFHVSDGGVCTLFPLPKHMQDSASHLMGDSTCPLLPKPTTPKFRGFNLHHAFERGKRWKLLRLVSHWFNSRIPSCERLGPGLKQATAND